MRARSVPAGAIVVALLAVGCSGDEANSGTDNTTADLLSQPVGDGVSTPLAVDESLVLDGPRVPVTDLGFNSGDSDAIVKVVELSDFGCGYCKQFHENSWPTILEEFVETGMVEWKFVPFVTGMFANSLEATEASECVMEQSQSAYERIVDRLWGEQSAWKGSSQPETVLRGWVSELEIDMEDFDSCLDEDRRINRVASQTTLARQVGVRGTPSFVILGSEPYPPLQGALPLELFQQIFTAIHAEEVRLMAEAANGADSSDTGNSGN